MALGINTNVASLSAQNQLNSSQRSNDQALERLSSGLRINSAKDDAAGLAISTRFSSQISGQNVAQRNANDGISYAQTAEGALGEITNALSRIRDLAVQSANDTNSASDRDALNQESQALVDEVERIAQSTQFNGQNILDGNLSELNFQVGANAGQTISVEGVDTRSTQLGASVLEGDSIENLVYSELTDTSLQIEGEDIKLADATSVKQIVERINNASEDTGVQARQNDSVSTTLDSSSLPAGGSAYSLVVNGETLDFDGGEDGGDIAAAVNRAGVGVEAAYDSGTDEVTFSSESSEITIGAVSEDALGITAGETSTFEAGITLTGAVGNDDFQVGGDGITSGNSDATDLGLSEDADDIEVNRLSTLSVATRDDASSAIETVDFALDQVNSTRAELGAVQSRFESTISNLASSTENLSAANSRILDADFAAETANLSKSQVLQQAGISVLAQANARPQQVLSLLQ